MKLNKFDLIKYVGWGIAAIAGIMVSWASDQQAKSQIDETVHEYISKAKEES